MTADHTERTIRRGNYSPEGLALDELALEESISAYQKACNMFVERVTADPVTNVCVDILGLAGSMGAAIPGSFPRLGIHTEKDFSQVWEREMEQKMAARGGDAGAKERIKQYPSDLDMLIREKMIVPDEAKRAFEQSMVGIQTQIFETTGIVVHPLSARMFEGSYTATKDLMGNRLAKRLRTKISAGYVANRRS